IQFGVAGLAWHAISSDRISSNLYHAADLRNAHHHFALQAAIKADALAKIAGMLAEIQVETLIIKGWAVAQSYADPHLRPFGDFDLCVSPGRYGEASAVLANHSDHRIQVDRLQIGHAYGYFHVETYPGGVFVVDLHRDLDKFHLSSLAAVFERSI